MFTGHYACIDHGSSPQLSLSRSLLNIDMASDIQLGSPVTGRRQFIVAVVSCLLLSIVVQAQNDEIRFRLIAVSTESDAALLREEIEGGAPFDELAGLYSIDPSGANGGSLGPIPFESMRQEYQNALEGLAPGETSPAIALDNAFLIFHRSSSQEERWMDQRNAGLAALEQEQYEDAEEFFNVAVARAEELGITDLRFARSMLELASFYQFQERYAEAQSLYERVLEIQALEVGLDHAVVGETLNNLAEVNRMQNLFAEAEPLYLRSLANFERSLGRDHLNVGIVLNNLGILYQLQNQHGRAQPLFLQSLEIMEQNVEVDDVTIAPTLANLGRAYHAQANYAEAGRTYRRALALLEPVVGSEDSIVREIRRDLNAASGRRPLPVNTGSLLDIPLQ